MKIDIRPRAAGKTYNLLRKAQEENLLIIVDTDEGAYHMQKYANDLGFNIRRPISATALAQGYARIDKGERVLVDEMARVLEAFIGRDIVIATMDTSRLARSEEDLI